MPESPEKRWVFATAPFSHNTPRSNFIARVGLLTAHRVRHITSASWCLASADNVHRAKLPENPANITLSGLKGLLIVNQWLGHENRSIHEAAKKIKSWFCRTGID